MSEFDQDVAGADSSSATQIADPTSQATTQPAQPNGDQNVPFHLHPRWQQMMRERQADREAIANYQRKLGEFEQRFQPRQKTEEELAREALHKLDPNIPKYGEELSEIKGAVSEFRQDRFASRGDQMISSFAEQHGLDGTALNARIVEIIASDPEYMARAQRGDLRIVQSLLRAIEPAVSQLKTQNSQIQRGQQVGLAQTKNALRNGPPRSAVGTTPGAAAPERFDPAKDSPQSFWEKASQRARQMTRSLAAEEG